MRSGVDDIVEPVGSFLAGAVHYGAVRQQNQKLQTEIDQLRSQAAAQADIDQRLKQLSALSNLPFVGNLQTVPAEVTDFGTSDFAATIDISVGRDEGVQLNMPVVGAGGLVGQVVQANHTTSTVRLITDGQSPVGVRYGTGDQLALAVLRRSRAGQAADRQPGAQGNTPSPRARSSSPAGCPTPSFPRDIPVATVVSRPERGHRVAGVGDPGAAGRSEPSPLRVGGAVRAVHVSAGVG